MIIPRHLQVLLLPAFDLEDYDKACKILKEEIRKGYYPGERDWRKVDMSLKTTLSAKRVEIEKMRAKRRKKLNEKV